MTYGLQRWNVYGGCSKTLWIEETYRPIAFFILRLLRLLFSCHDVSFCCYSHCSSFIHPPLCIFSLYLSRSITSGRVQMFEYQQNWRQLCTICQLILGAPRVWFQLFTMSDIACHRLSTLFLLPSSGYHYRHPIRHRYTYSACKSVINPV